MKITGELGNTTGLALGLNSPSETSVVQELVGALLLLGKDDGAQRLRLQVGIAAPYLKGAVLEAEPGLARDHLARRLYAASGAAMEGLLLCHAATAGALEELCLQQTLQGVLISAFEHARPAVQRRLAALILQSQLQQGTRWLVLTERPIQTLLTEKRIVPELARVLPEVTVRLTPLRERSKDVHCLAMEVRHQLRAMHVPLTPEVVSALEAHSWPGDLDEFARVTAAWFRQEEPSARSLQNLLLSTEPGSRTVPPSDRVAAGDGPTLLQDVIDRHLLRILQRCNGNKLRTAEMLGISRSTLYRMLEAATPL